MNRLLKNMSKGNEVQKIATIVKILTGNEYQVEDLANRKIKVYSNISYKIGDTVVIQGNVILSSGRFNTNVKSFEV